MIKKLLIIIPLTLTFCVSCDYLGNNDKDSNDITSTNTENDVNNTFTGTIYYVSPNGNDTNKGNIKEKPLKTIQRGIDSLESGDKVIILAGEYNEECYIENKKFNRMIWIEGMPGTVMNGKRTMREALIVEESANVSISGLEVKNYRCVGINVLYSEYITVKENTAFSNGFDSSEYTWDHEGYGINLKYSNYITVDGNNIYENGPYQYIIDMYGKLGTGLNTFELKNSQIINNKSFNNRGGGILVEDATNVTVAYNIVSNHHHEAHFSFDPNKEETWWCGGIWIDGGKNVVVYNNSFINNKAGILISNIDDQNPSGYLIKNNQIKSNYYGIEVNHFDKTVSKEIINFVRNIFINNNHNILYSK